MVYNMIWPLLYPNRPHYMIPMKRILKWLEEQTGLDIDKVKVSFEITLAMKKKANLLTTGRKR